jgi:uncharacterized protein
MKALVTGGSSGIGRDMAIYLSKLGYDVILVSKDENKLKSVSKSIKNSSYYVCDISSKEECIRLYNKVKSENIELLINNAGFGKFGEFNEINLEDELNMIDVNIKGVHILTKLFLNDFIKRNSGYILNVASLAAFEPGPLMATYYSSKAYVLRLTTSIYEELRRMKSNVHVSVFCPGPVRTNFNNVANVRFEIKSISSDYAAKYAIDKMFKNKLIIIPTFYMKTIVFLTRLVPTKLLARIAYNIQNKKR